MTDALDVTVRGDDAALLWALAADIGTRSPLVALRYAVAMAAEHRPQHASTIGVRRADRADLDGRPRCRCHDEPCERNGLRDGAQAWRCAIKAASEARRARARRLAGVGR